MTEEQKQCAACGKPDSETLLFTIILPPTIMEKQELCSPCLKQAIDDSKKSGKALEK